MCDYFSRRLSAHRARILGLLLLSLAPAVTVAELQKPPPVGDTFANRPSGFEDLYSGKEPLPTFYHTTKDLRDFVGELAAPGPGNCPGLRLIRSTFPNAKSAKANPITELEGEAAWTYKGADGEAFLDTVIISRRNSSIGKPNLRYALFFGEHGRELISAEVGIYLLKAFCGRSGVDSEVQKRAQDLLSYAEVMILPTVDQSGRKAAEEGTYCDRDNFDQVDLNRNWDYGWDSAAVHGNDPGRQPFSEPETQIAKKHLEAFKPNAFLSVHSGDQALWTPGAYDTDDSAAKERKGAAVWNTLLAMSSHVKDYTHCNCKVGAPGKLAHIRHPGTSIDYVGLKMNVPYAMAWEIWLDGSHSCLPHFSPTASEEYHRVLQKWSLAMVYFGEAAMGALGGLQPVSVLAPPRASRPLPARTLRVPKHHHQRVVSKDANAQHRLEAAVSASPRSEDGKTQQESIPVATSPTTRGEPVHLRPTISQANEIEGRRLVMSYFGIIFIVIIVLVTFGMFWNRRKK